MARQLKLLLARAEHLVTSRQLSAQQDAQRRNVLHWVIRKLYGLETLSDDEIGARCDVSGRTVARVRDQLQAHWPTLVEDGRRAIRELESYLRPWA
jgi:hypothetical protein